MQQQKQQPRADEDDEQDQERAPSFLTARELQAREPSRSAPQPGRDEESAEAKKKR